MAVLSKIRQRSLLLILVIGFCLLAFIIGDIINSGGFGVSKEVGSVNGKDIMAQEFFQKVNDMQSRQQGQGVTTTAASNAVWNQEVDNILFAERFDKTGIRVGKEHVYNMYAQDPSVAQNPQFLNALGKFDKAKFNEFLVNMKTTNPAQYQMIERNVPLVEDMAKRQLYVTMLKAGFYTTDAEAKAKYKSESDKASFDYVYVPFTTINDDQVKVSDDEIIAFMKKNEKKYKSEASREIEFVKFDSKPSAADEAEMKSSINALLAPSVKYDEKTGKNDTIQGFGQLPAGDVAEFVAANSEMGLDTMFYSKERLPVEHAEQLFNLPVGGVFGPYIDNGYYKISRMMKKGGSVTASHILIGFQTRSKEEAKLKAEDLLKQVNANPGSFAQLAKDNSEDPGSKDTGGEYKDIVPGQMVPTFDKFIFNNPVGATGIVETQFGYHVIKVTGKSDAVKAVQLATVAQKIQASEKTTDEVFTKASKMEMDAETKPFADLAKQYGLTVNTANKVLANEEAIQGLGNNREIVKWAFNKDTKVGDVKKFDLPMGQGHVVARLKAVNEKGLLPLEEAKTVVLPILRNEKKAELIKKKMAGATLEEVAQKTGSSVATATDVTLAAPMIPNVGGEPKVVGKAFALAAGKTSGLIVGQTGVFMVRAKGVVAAPELPNYSAYTTRMKAESRGGVTNRISAVLKDKADIVDNRAEFN
ncbi:SurA N-terminal domain-containing protein [Flavobacterium sp. MFBS3-15]|uniref:peptidylprolyl isomerase n=1 Tax=Flavobacterium sp. MFBS3-15 TaxID=2989816 RepID=UPI002236092A|nr:peptidylprolyl isomerase [Flavobacterium sp. MFBS3-15]MCW4468697.1 SurA N-terminal domain-containing protein [Flavobacterium sp. MFBS3-15]